MSTPALRTRPAWALLEQHYRSIKDLHLRQLFADDRARGERLAVDVNGKFDLVTAIAFGKAIEGYGLRWYEEPLDPLDYLAHAALATEYGQPLATGENLFSHQDARNLLRHGGMRPDRDWLQFDCALSFGLCEYQRTLAALKVAGWGSAGETSGHASTRPVPARSGAAGADAGACASAAVSAACSGPVATALKSPQRMARVVCARGRKGVPSSAPGGGASAWAQASR